MSIQCNNNLLFRVNLQILIFKDKCLNLYDYLICLLILWFDKFIYYFICIIWYFLYLIQRK